MRYTVLQMRTFINISVSPCRAMRLFTFLYSYCLASLGLSPPPPVFLGTERLQRGRHAVLVPLLQGQGGLQQRHPDGQPPPGWHGDGAYCHGIPVSAILFWRRYCVLLWRRYCVSPLLLWWRCYCIVFFLLLEEE